MRQVILLANALLDGINILPQSIAFVVYETPADLLLNAAGDAAHQTPHGTNFLPQMIVAAVYDTTADVLLNGAGDTAR